MLSFLITFYLSVNFKFHFSTSFPEPLGQFHPHLAQSTLRQRGLKVVKIKDHAVSQGGIIGKYRNFLEILKKSSSQEPFCRKELCLYSGIEIVCKYH